MALLFKSMQHVFIRQTHILYHSQSTATSKISKNENTCNSIILYRKYFLRTHPVV